MDRFEAVSVEKSIICTRPYLKPLVLEHLLNGDELSSVAEFGLVDDAEAAIADELHVGIADLLRSVGALPRRRYHSRHLRAVLACKATQHSLPQDTLQTDKHIYVLQMCQKILLEYILICLELNIMNYKPS